MKRKGEDPDLEKLIGEVAAEHVPGRAGNPAGLFGKTTAGPRPAAASGRGRLLEALRSTRDARSEAAVQESGESSDSGVAAAEEAESGEGDGISGEGSPRDRGGRQERQAARLRADLAALQAELDRAKSERKALKDELGREARTRIALEKSLEAERGRVETAAQARFDEWRRRVGLEFSHPAEKEAVERERSRISEALAGAVRALERQSASNGKYGTVRALREDYERIGKMLEELRFAEAESLHVVPELTAARKALEEQRRRMLGEPKISSLIAPPGPDSVPLSLLAIDALPDGKSALPLLERFDGIVESLRETGLIDSAGCEGVRRRLREKLLRLVRAESSRSPGKAGMGEETFEALVREGGASRHELLVDGNNLLVTNETAFGDGGVIPGFAGRRERLNRKLGQLAPSFRHVYAVYDGTEDREEPQSDRFTVVYTHKRVRLADDWIAAHVARGKGPGCILATDDEGLIARCRAAHGVIGSRHLYDYLASRLRS